MSLKMELEVLSTSRSLSDYPSADVAELLSVFGLDVPLQKQPSDKLHGSATTTRDQRKYIQQSKKSQRRLAVELGVDPKTIATWKQRTSVDDAQMGPKRGSVRALTETQRIAIATYCRHRKAPLNTLLSELRKLLPHLTRSTLYRCLKLLEQEASRSTTASMARKTSAARTLTPNLQRGKEIYLTAMHRG